MHGRAPAAKHEQRVKKTKDPQCDSEKISEVLKNNPLVSKINLLRVDIS